jgi:hypothetical protein
MPNRLVTTIVFAAMLSLLGARAGHAATDAGEVLTFNGDCFIVAGDQRTALKMGDKVHVGDVLDVPQKARLKLRMIDGSILSLASGTHLTIQAYDVDAGKKLTAKIGLDAGLLHAVSAQEAQGSSFEVDTALAIATAQSTNWFIGAVADKTQVYVLNGSIGLAARDAKGNAARGAVTVAANSVSEVDAAPPAPPPPEVKPGTRPRPAPPPRQPVPTPPRPLAQSELGPLIDLTSVSFGWCQCISDITAIRASCESSVDGCKTTCGGSKYSFIPNARLSCARSYADVPPGPASQP